MVKVIWHLR